MSRQILSMQKIDKHYTGVHALRQVDFDLDEGEIHALVGENGAGKSTLMRFSSESYRRTTAKSTTLVISSTHGTPNTLFRWESESSIRS